MISRLWFYNEVISITALTWFVAQIIKIIITLIRNKKFDWRIIYSSGGMPSAHTATVTAITLTIGIIFGFNSGLFALSFIMACIVIYDTLGVRQAAGDHAKVLNKMVPRILKEEKDIHFKTRLGHKNNEVLAGIILGFIIPFIFLFNRIKWHPKIKEFFSYNYLFNLNPGSSFTYLIHFLIGYTFLFITAIFLFLINRRLKNLIQKKLISKIYNLLFTISIIGCLLLLFRYEGIYFLSSRILFLLLIVSFFVWSFYLLYYFLKIYPQEKKDYEDYLRKKEYLPHKK